MRFLYGERNLHRALDEVEFWKRQEAEHTVVIRQIAPNLEEKYVEKLSEMEHLFSQAEVTATKYIETIIRSGNIINPVIQQQIIMFIKYCLRQSQDFVNLLNEILKESKAVKDNMVAQVVIKHIRRESEYFIGIIQTISSYY